MISKIQVWERILDNPNPSGAKRSLYEMKQDLFNHAQEIVENSKTEIGLHQMDKAPYI
jgi:hypothetical protein